MCSWKKISQLPPLHEMSTHAWCLPHQYKATFPFTAGLAVELYRLSFFFCQPVLSFAVKWLSPELS